ncbi:MAG: phosphopyruvate hydratase [Candidatus Micrarchaeota archaeon]|nr:phosphopyruvate hydratase [Candidatus Micrarchaeota archaeon]
MRGYSTGGVKLQIKEVSARMVFDSRGNPTLRATILTPDGIGWADAPSGASTGKHEAIELRDGGQPYHGKGVAKAIENVRLISDALRGMDCSDQKKIDTAIIGLDGTPNKARLGANATTAVSLAVARAAAACSGKELFDWLCPGASRLPIPMMNIINGGKHAGSGLAIQEFMIVPAGAKSFSEAMQMGVEIFHTLKGIIEDKYGKAATSVGDEGGFAPKIKRTRDALDIIMKAIEKCGYAREVKMSLDCAASSFFIKGKYKIDGKSLSKSKMLEYYIALLGEYPLFSIEDPFDEEDFESFAALNKERKCKVIGDDLTVTNIHRIEAAINKGAIDTLLLKVNQVGTLTEAMDAATLCKNNKCGVVVSHRSGETCDPFIADLAVALECGMIKAGAPCRGERLAKYNRLLEIESLLGDKATYGLPQ